MIAVINYHKLGDVRYTFITLVREVRSPNTKVSAGLCSLWKEGGGKSLSLRHPNSLARGLPLHLLRMSLQPLLLPSHALVHFTLLPPSYTLVITSAHPDTLG